MGSPYSGISGACIPNKLPGASPMDLQPRWFPHYLGKLTDDPDTPIEGVVVHPTEAFPDIRRHTT